MLDQMERPVKTIGSMPISTRLPEMGASGESSRAK
jgi:hypothetical protein